MLAKCTDSPAARGCPRRCTGPYLRGRRRRELDRKLRQALPEPVCVGTATVGQFCCETHDQKFNPIDELDVRSVLTPSDLDEHCRNLMFHRAVIRQLHRDTAFKVYRRELHQVVSRAVLSVGRQSPLGPAQRCKPTVAPGCVAICPGYSGRIPMARAAHRATRSRGTVGSGLRRRFPRARHLGFHGRAPCRGPPCGLPPLHRPSPAPGTRAAGGVGRVGRSDRGRGRVTAAGVGPAGRGGTAHLAVPSGSIARRCAWPPQPGATGTKASRTPSGNLFFSNITDGRFRWTASGRMPRHQPV